MELTDLLLVTRNYRGQCEENFISTVDEFIDEWCRKDRPDVADDIKRVLIGAEPFKWDCTYYARPDDSLDLRFCQSKDDLLNFLDGRFNDSIEEMEARNPGSVGLYDHWYWENNPDMFSIRAIETVKNYFENTQNRDSDFKNKLFSIMPDFPVRQGSRIEDLIHAAEQQKTNVKRVGISAPTMEM